MPSFVPQYFHPKSTKARGLHRSLNKPKWLRHRLHKKKKKKRKRRKGSYLFAKDLLANITVNRKDVTDDCFDKFRTARRQRRFPVIRSQSFKGVDITSTPCERTNPSQMHMHQLRANVNLLFLQIVKSPVT